ncbi:MAG TPA: hypothetical protein DCW72_02375 [Elusimicrobia bacterium]|nr:MAG: hypothetical protein A2X29_00565 [Elusimicrobia bacterium GWA2_64_40]OGR66134.1 MAG: hypothetical protein A2X30_09865 [Elusimicrobia bacterium GWB2_63_16]HAN03671.1 hypothetical protein [Elusimicrobiota bacterium]HAU89101.1 hypothetical protein [Elusimicrobiota bacterium]
MEEIGFDRFMELGARHVAGGDPDRAIHYYNSAIRTEPGSAPAYIGLARALSLKARGGGAVFETLALDALRKAELADPSSAEAHAMLLASALRAGRLGDMAAEYRAKLRGDPGNAALKARLREIYALSLMDTGVKLPPVGYKPVLCLKVLFDCVLLPLGSSIIIAANVIPKARPSLMIGVLIFLCYGIYRGLIWFFSRGQRLFYGN